MIRIRDTHGSTRDLPSTERFVEICDNDGIVAFAVYQDDSGRVVIAEPDTPEGRRYAKTFGIKFAEHVVLPKFLTEIEI
jgi:hypothetical protein